MPALPQVVFASQPKLVQQTKPLQKNPSATPAENPGEATLPLAVAAENPKQMPAPASNAADTGDAGRFLSGREPIAEQGLSGLQTAETLADTTPQPPVFAAVLDRYAVPIEAGDAALNNAAGQPASPDVYNVAGQIVDHARLITRPENSEMVIKLKPEHLGELTLKIVVEAGMVSATFHSANPEVRNAIEASLPQLKQDMSSQGIKVDYVGVYTSLDQFSGSEQYHTPRQSAQQPAGKARRAAAVEEVTAAAAIAPQISLSGIDYRI